MDLEPSSRVWGSMSDWPPWATVTSHRDGYFVTQGRWVGAQLWTETGSHFVRLKRIEMLIYSLPTKHLRSPPDYNFDLAAEYICEGVDGDLWAADWVYFRQIRF
jgi:hypothetical protein